MFSALGEFKTITVHCCGSAARWGCNLASQSRAEFCKTGTVISKWWSSFSVIWPLGTLGHLYVDCSQETKSEGEGWVGCLSGCGLFPSSKFCHREIVSGQGFVMLGMCCNDNSLNISTWHTTSTHSLSIPHVVIGLLVYFHDAKHFSSNSLLSCEEIKYTTPEAKFCYG